MTSLGAVLVWFALLGVPVALVFVAAMTGFQRLWLPSPVLAPVFGVLGTALAAWAVFGAYWAHPVAGLVTASAALGGSIVVVARGRLWRHLRAALPLLALLLGSIVFSVGFAYLWGAGSDPYTVVENRFFYFTLPIDNTLPHLFGDRLALHQSTHLLIGDWNGGDRPPLQTGFELLFSPVIAAGQGIARLTGVGGDAIGSIGVVGLGGTMPVGAAFALDVFAQYLWVPAGYGLLRMLGFGTRPTIGALVLVSLIPTTVVNTLFTWPKLLSAALVLTSLALLLAARRRGTPRSNGLFVAAVVAAVMGVLAHGAAAFAIPALVVLGLWALRGRGVRASFTPIGLGATLGLVLYLPWLAYQRFADPPGDRLLKWHLAGVTTPTPDSFLSVLVDRYSALPLSEAVHNRLEGLATLVGLDQGHLLFVPLHRLTVGLRTEDWTSTLFALGVAGVASLVAFVVWSAIRRRSLDATDRQRLLLVGAMALCMLVWWLVLFEPNATIVAQGSQSWVFVLALVPVAWVLERAPRTGLALICLQAAVLVVVYFGVVLIDAEPVPLSRAAAVVCGLGLACLLVLPLALTPPAPRPPGGGFDTRRSRIRRGDGIS
jgi:hypothetical protein